MHSFLTGYFCNNLQCSKSLGECNEWQIDFSFSENRSFRLRAVQILAKLQITRVNCH